MNINKSYGAIVKAYVYICNIKSKLLARVQQFDDAVSYFIMHVKVSLQSWNTVRLNKKKQPQNDNKIKEMSFQDTNIPKVDQERALWVSAAAL